MSKKKKKKLKGNSSTHSLRGCNILAHASVGKCKAPGTSLINNDDVALQFYSNKVNV